MAVFTDLPTEILEVIYHFLGSIDDVHHLGRTCKATTHVIRRRSVYLEIMRSVIYCSSQHRHDYQLNRILHLHKDVAAFVEQSKARLPTTVHPNRHFNCFEKRLLRALSPEYNRAALTDEEICDILARYQGLRVLQGIWLERQLEVQDYLSVDDDLDDQGLYNKFSTLITRDDEFGEGALPKRYSRTEHTYSYNSLDGDQRGRFHAAVVRVWLLNEIRWILMHFAERVNFANQIFILDVCKARIKDGEDTPLVDVVDEYAVFTFMYHHVLPRHITFLVDRDSSKLPFTFVSDFSRDGANWSRLFRVCLMAGQVHFQPPDLIDLMLRSRMSRKLPYPSMTMPESSEKWRHPLPALVRCGVNLYSESKKRSIHNLLSRHIRLMARSSFHQDRLDVFQPVLILPPQTPSWPARPHVLDHASKYFAYQVVVAIKRTQPVTLKDLGAMFGERGVEMLWEVWWWASSEDKTRMQMRRWWTSKFA